MRTRHLMLVLLPLSLGACVTARATMLVPTEGLTPVPEEQVVVYLPTDTVPERCQRIAIINLSGDASMTDEAQMIQAAKRRAGKIGANAVQLGETRDPTTGRQIARAVFGPMVNADRKGNVLAFNCAAEQTGFWRRVGEALGLVD